METVTVQAKASSSRCVILSVQNVSVSTKQLTNIQNTVKPQKRRRIRAIRDRSFLEEYIPHCVAIAISAIESVIEFGRCLLLGKFSMYYIVGGEFNWG